MTYISWSCDFALYLEDDVWMSFFGIMSQYDPTIDLKISVGHCDLYFMVQWFCLISWRLFDVWTSYFGIMSLYDPMFDLKKCRSQGPCFMVQWVCLISWRLFDVWTSYFDSVWHIWPRNKSKSLKIYGVIDLYVMFHWFLPFIIAIDLNYLYTLRPLTSK